jgi:hypothetical protein
MHESIEMFGSYVVELFYVLYSYPKLGMRCERMFKIQNTSACSTMGKWLQSTSTISLCPHNRG